jgi:Cd2+/Zn2+-exporting ATPase
LSEVTGVSSAAICTTCGVAPPGFFQRYRGFLTSPGTLVAAGNALLLALGFIASSLGQPTAARWLYLASALVGGAPILKLATTNIVRDFDLTAGVMVSIAMIAALIVGEYSAAALVAFMMLIGEMLEDFTMARADRALEGLEQLIPATATLRYADRDETVPLAAVRRGDRVLVRPGGRVPVDGRVRDGSATIDQSAITGESIPVDVGPGGSVYAGTLCTSGAIEVEVARVGEGTALGEMIALVKGARATQAPVQRMANHYAQYLTPLALGIAVLTYLVTRDVTRSITVLIVICPCSLVLATPTALVAAIGNAARHGVLVKHGPAMEQVGRVDVVAFDKTGTLTLGEPRVHETVSLNGIEAPELLALAASAERASEHPLGAAIVAAARAAELDVAVAQDFQGARQRMYDLQAAGHTVLPLAVDGALAGLVAIADTVRDASRQAIAGLKAIGIARTVLISGDHRAAAEAVGRALGVDEIHGEMLPQDKLALIRDLQAAGRRVAFVGDGVNDAPALAAADVGIAMGSIGTAVAMETADIVLLSDHVERLPYLIGLSRMALGTIRNNVVFSMSMNVLSVALGVLGMIGPVLGAAMHEASALPVVANSARLIGRTPRQREEKQA